jgi:hypothetical protein
MNTTFSGEKKRLDSIIIDLNEKLSLGEKNQGDRIKELEKNILVLNINKNNANSNTNFGSKMESLAKSYNNIYNLNKDLKKSDTVDSGSTYIIKQPPTPYGQSSPSEFYQGSINPINKRILRQNINIDTRFRDNYYANSSTNFK